MIREENRIPVEEFRKHCAAIVRRVTEGERFYLTKHGRPVALLAAPADEEIIANRDTLAEPALFVPRQKKTGSSTL